MPRLTSTFAVIALMLASRASAQSYGFISRLGRDTVTVERITRVGNRVTGDLVERSPRVVQRHYEAQLAADGSVELFTIETKVLNPDPRRPVIQRIQAHFAADSIHVTTRADNDTARISAIPTNGNLAMPWLIYGPGTAELLLGAALKRSGDTIPTGYYVPGGRILTPGYVRRLGNGAASYDFFGAPIIGKFDAEGRLQSLSGLQSTIKTEVERLSIAPDVEAVAAGFAAAEKAAGPLSALSVRDTARATLGTATLLVDYGRPTARGRTILGNVVPYGAVWRTGANAATQFTTTAAITVGGLELAPGTYTLWTLPTSNGAQLIVNKQIKQWGTEYHAEQDLGRVAAKAEKLSSPVEKFTISLVPSGASNGTLVMEWDNFRWSVPITVR